MTSTRFISVQHKIRRDSERTREIAMKASAIASSFFAAVSMSIWVPTVFAASISAPPAPAASAAARAGSAPAIVAPAAPAAALPTAPAAVVPSAPVVIVPSAPLVVVPSAPAAAAPARAAKALLFSFTLSNSTTKSLTVNAPPPPPPHLVHTPHVHAHAVEQDCKSRCELICRREPASCDKSCITTCTSH